MSATDPVLKPLKWRNTTVDFFNFTGEVIDVSAHAETHVSSHGGGGYVGQHGGRIEAPQVSSHIVTETQIWMRLRNGEEQCIRVSDRSKIPMRVGQWITVIHAGGSDSGHQVILVNHNAGKYWYLDAPVRLTQRFLFSPGCLLSLLIGLGSAMVGVAVGAVLGWLILLLSGLAKPAVIVISMILCGLVGLLLPERMNLRKHRALREAIYAHATKAAEALCVKPPPEKNLRTW